MDSESNTQWHEIFATILADQLTGYPFEVTPELDLSLQQFADASVVAIEGTDLDSVPLTELPDGLRRLGPHNLFSFKSAHESFDWKAWEELITYGVAYAKVKAGKQWRALLGEIQLFAVATRKPACDQLGAHTDATHPGIY